MCSAVVSAAGNGRSASERFDRVSQSVSQNLFVVRPLKFSVREF